MKLNHPDFLVREKKRKLEGRKRGKVGAWSCTECEYRTSNIFNLRDHTMRLHLSSLFTCQLCQVRFSNRTAAVTHVRQDHGKLFEEKYRGWARKFINNACKVSNESPIYKPETLITLFLETPCILNTTYFIF